MVDLSNISSPVADDMGLGAWAGGNNGTLNVSPHEEVMFEEYNQTCGVFDFIIEAVMMGLLCLFGFTGNTLSIMCLMRDRSKTATPLLLVSLEVADTIFLVTVLILRVITTIHQFTGTMEFLRDFLMFSGRYLFPAAQVAMTFTIYLTILVTVNRFISVCRPYEASTLCSIYHAKRHIILVAIFSIMFNIPRFFEYKVTHVFNPSTNRTDFRSDLRPFAASKVYQIIYANALYFIVLFLIPLVTLSIMNYKLITALREAKKKRAQLLKSDRDGNSRSEEDITLILIVVVLIFVVCQTPALFTQVLATLLSQDDRLCDNPYFFYERISDLLVVGNSSINFIVYCFCSRRFRQILLDLVCKKKEAEYQPSTKNHTVNSVV